VLAASFCLCGTVAGTFVFGGCPAVDNPYRAYPSPAYNDFVAKVQPIVGPKCGNLGCHGSRDRTLTLYAVGFLRAPPPFAGASLMENQLTDTELAWNYDALRIRLLDEPDKAQARLLLKCLPVSKGGILHGGGVEVFPDTSDPNFQALAAWAKSAK